VKSSAGESIFDRIFITGVSPVVMSDITSGYNIAENIYFDPDFSDLCGFTEKEIETAALGSERVLSFIGQKPVKKVIVVGQKLVNVVV